MSKYTKDRIINWLKTNPYEFTIHENGEYLYAIYAQSDYAWDTLNNLDKDQPNMASGTGARICCYGQYENAIEFTLP